MVWSMSSIGRCKSNDTGPVLIATHVSCDQCCCREDFNHWDV